MAESWFFFTERVPVGVRIAQVVGITSAAYLCGKLMKPQVDASKDTSLTAA